MIVKILGKSASFNGVRYNTDKVKTGKGELIQARNFGALNQLGTVRPQDYINYLKAWTASSKQIKFPQLHVAISAKGHSQAKEQLSEIAEAWLKEMGYGKNPYLLIYHRDTANSHIHLVSSRVGPDGKKISDSYEKIRAYKALDKVMGREQAQEVAADLAVSLEYSFSTPAQWMMLLEAKGYTVRKKEDCYELIKFGSVQEKIALAEIQKHIASYPKDRPREDQLRAIFRKYSTLYSTELIKDSEDRGNPYRTELSGFLSEKFGIEFRFHAKNGLPPYGYTVIDHAAKQVFKGGEILSLAEFSGQVKAPDLKEIRKGDPDAARIYPPVEDHHLGIVPSGNIPVPIGNPIAGDIDDEQVHGRKRRRRRPGAPK